MLAHHMRLRPNISPALGRRFVFAGNARCRLPISGMPEVCVEPVVDPKGVML